MHHTISKLYDGVYASRGRGRSSAQVVKSLAPADALHPPKRFALLRFDLASKCLCHPRLFSMRMTFRYLLVLALACLSVTSHAAANDATREALNQIKELANAMCDEVPLNGAQQSWQLSGEVKAKLEGAIKAAADAGFTGAGKYRGDNYSGLLQKDLLTAQQNRNDCRKFYFDRIVDKLLKSDKGSSPHSSATVPNDVSLTFDDFSFEPATNTLTLRGVFNNSRANPVTVTSLEFEASHEQQEAGRILEGVPWSPLPLSPHEATPYSMTVSLGGNNGLPVQNRENLPIFLFVLVRAVDGNGHVTWATKHFMTLDALSDMSSVHGTLFSMPLAILQDTRPVTVYKLGSKHVSFLLKPIATVVD
jgi:hypothetical protein